MPLEHILRAMQAQADNEIAQLTRSADDEIAQLIADAESQAQTIRARHHARVEPLLANETASIQNQAKLAALRALTDAREQLLNQAFAQAQVCLAQMRESERYPAIFRALAREAVDALAGDSPLSQEQNLIVRVDPRDVTLARQVFSELGTSFKIETEPIALGGLQVTTHDARLVVTNTLAGRLERARNTLRGLVARILVGPPESNKEWTTTTVTATPA
ncbi:MAG: V-type ATP synthase subunit E [Chloroflexi bacterium]|nr:V-type ATP synthase subunit E [Chloroflexota bacterium]